MVHSTTSMCGLIFGHSASLSNAGSEHGKVFITGSSDGLGQAAARSLLGMGHEVVLHARSKARAATMGDFAARSAGVVTGDLSRANEVKQIAGQVNAIGRMDAIIHNAGSIRSGAAERPRRVTRTLLRSTRSRLSC